MFAISSAALLAAGCAHSVPEGALIADPYEGLNRDFHSFNVGVDQVALRPLARGYETVTPTLFQHMISNGVDHIRLPIDFLNYMLQGDLDAAGSTAGRLLVNTVMGMGGLLDPAVEMGLPYEPTDFGLTMASWGVEEGAFVMLPFFGPSTERDFVGRLVDFGLNPFTYITFGGGTGQVASATLQVVTPPLVFRAENMDVIDEAFYEREDSYTVVRSGWVQNRRSRVAGGVDVESLPDIYEE
jgi:phospholipid-binding lipoprotein MlaA